MAISNNRKIVSPEWALKQEQITFSDYDHKIVEYKYVAGCLILIYDRYYKKENTSQRRIVVYRPNGSQITSSIIFSQLENRKIYPR